MTVATDAVRGNTWWGMCSLQGAICDNSILEGE
jgi:hypothetical protein